MDHSKLVQVLVNPLKADWYITVETITQNLFPVDSPLIDAALEQRKKPADQCECGKTLEYKNCITGEHIDCARCDDQKAASFVTNSCDTKDCEEDWPLCQFCHFQVLVENLVLDKTRLHSSYLETSISISPKIDFVREPQKPKMENFPTSQIYTLVRFWREDHSCAAEFYVEDKAVFFQNKFLLLGEQNELFYFTKSSE